MSKIRRHLADLIHLGVPAELLKPVNDWANENEKPYTLWLEAYSTTGQASPPRNLGTYRTLTLNHAVELHLETVPPESRYHWRYWPALNYWTFCGSRIWDNETDARGT